MTVSHDSSNHLRSRQRRLSGAFAAVCIISVVGGCGAAKYEERLEATIKMLQHVELLNQNLGREFRRRGIQIRPPQQFTLLPPPKMVEDENGQMVYPEIDERQPYFFDLPLPGIVGAWGARLPVQNGDPVDNFNGFMYVLSNLSSEHQGSIGLFKQQMEDVLARELNETAGIDSWEGELFPKSSGEGYVETIPYRSRVIIGELQDDELKLRCSIYFYPNLEDYPHLEGRRVRSGIISGDGLVIVMFIVPQDVEPGERLGRRISLCLETLEVNHSSKGESSKGSTPGKPGSGAQF